MLEGRIYQNAYVTRNIDQTVAAFTAQADARSAVQFEATSEVLTASGRQSQTIKLAFIWVGDFQYEVIEPVREAVPLFSRGPALPLPRHPRAARPLHGVHLDERHRLAAHRRALTPTVGLGHVVI
jgi:hypothetical protein